MQLTDKKSRAILQFGRCLLVPHRGELLVDGVAVDLGHRALEILLVLIEARGDLVTKDEILERVWPGIVVEENTLQVHISALRKALGGDRDLLKTLSGRGYRFIGNITTEAGAEEPLPEHGATWPVPLADGGRLSNLPAPVSDLIGRQSEIKAILGLASQARMLTLVGAGGIGKTRLGLEVARQLLPSFPDGVWVTELGTLSDPELVPVAVVTALGLTLAAGALSPERVAAALGAKRVLLILDNCEHVIESAARMAEALLRVNPLTHVMATSREPLRASGETVYRVPPLEVPPEDMEPAGDVSQHSAVILFVERARAADAYFSLDRHTAAITGAICRRLDGIPLAIELAAARAPALGVEALAARLDDRFRLLTAGHRTALPRHQTLQATLDWSYELLPESERLVLGRLAVFAGGFALGSASAVAASGEITPSHVIDCVVNLVAKSLLTVDLRGPIAHYRLLDTTRAYARQKLTERGELEPIARRHAECCRDMFERAEADSRTLPTAEWLAAYGREIDNVRAALDWAFSPSGDAAIGVALTVAAVPLWTHLSLMEECRARVERALASLGSGGGQDARREMQLFAALGASLTYTKSPLSESGAAWTNALEIAESIGDNEYQLRALWGLWIYRLGCGECRTTLALAQRFCTLGASSADPGDVFVGDRMIGVSMHYLGDQTTARRHIERMLDGYVTSVQRSHIIRFQFDQRVAGRMILARILWLQGFPDQALRTAQDNVADARRGGHALSLYYALEGACLIPLFVGDLPAAERSVAMLLDHSARHRVSRWHAWGRCFEGALLVKRGEVSTGLGLLRTALDDLRETKFVLRYTAVLGDLAQALSLAGEIAQGLEAVDEALERSERNDERWCVAELLRIKSELVLSEHAPNAEAVAERLFQQGLDWARRQGALSWELRCATSLARLWHEQGLTDQAREFLGAVYGRFTEGFGTADLKAAKALLEAFR